ncbi:MAG TPA: hypothetical protein VJN42_10270 [Candidatus Acidoferrum sp.]|nr:hypothetical protein [Candidatus Acidoferrum sp.]
MLTFISIIVLGFFLGMRHATDADHVIAVTTIVSRQRSIKSAVMIGALWGLGHTLTIFLVGSAIVVFGWVVPKRIGLTMELSVGLMLVLLGILNLSGILRWLTQTFTPSALADSASAQHSGHAQSDAIHSHPHSHIPERRGRLGLYQLVRPLAVGIVHGLAGSAAVALLVLTTIGVPRWAILYLLVFGVGTIAGMMLITAAIAVPFVASAPRLQRLNRGLSFASGFISLAFGLFIVYQMGYVNGLFTSHPNWTPR